MKIIIRILLIGLACLCAAQLVLPAGADSRTHAAAVQGARNAAGAGESATIIPVGNFSIGNSLPSGSGGDNVGFGLVANGITDYWATSPTGTVDFVFFVFPARQAVTQNISFAVTSPSGATVYATSWKNSKFGFEGTWFYVYAKGNYGTAGIYKATVSADNTVIGQIPVVLAPPSH